MKLLLSLLLLLILPITSTWAKLPYVPIEFPRADAAHFEDSNTLTEWWYFNGKLTTNTGKKFGYYVIYSYAQLKIFGSIIKAPCFILQITDLDTKKVYGGINRLLPIQRLDKNTLDIMLGKNITLQKIENTYLIDAVMSSNTKDKLHISLQLKPERPVLLNGPTGYIDGWDNSSMYYYSQPHLKTSGTFEIENQQYIINSEQSVSWMNRQWTDYSLNSATTQWQWANAQLDNGIDLDVWQIYDPKTQTYVSHHVNVLLPDGKVFYSDTLTYHPHEHPTDKYPQIYDLDVPEINLHLTFTTAAPNQDVSGFWEGMNDITGVFNNVPVHGHGYTENTLKATAFKAQ